MLFPNSKCAAPHHQPEHKSDRQFISNSTRHASCPARHVSTPFSGERLQYKLILRAVRSIESGSVKSPFLGVMDLSRRENQRALCARERAERGSNGRMCISDRQLGSRQSIFHVCAKVTRCCDTFDVQTRGSWDQRRSRICLLGGVLALAQAIMIGSLVLGIDHRSSDQFEVIKGT